MNIKINKNNIINNQNINELNNGQYNIGNDNDIDFIGMFNHKNENEIQIEDIKIEKFESEHSREEDK